MPPSASPPASAPRQRFPTRKQALILLGRELAE
jgi:hypothetical protein